MTPCSYVLRGAPFCPVAQTVRTALVLCRATWVAEAAPEGVSAWLTVTDEGGPRPLSDPLQMLDAVAAGHPTAALLPQDAAARDATRALAALALDLRRRLSAVTRATDSIDCDMAVHRLRAGLAELESALPRPDPSTPVDLAGAALAPPLWRMRVLDAHHETFLLTGLPVLAAWAAALADHPAVRTALGAGAQEVYLDLLARRGAALVARADAVLWRLLDAPGRALRGLG